MRRHDLRFAVLSIGAFVLVACATRASAVERKGPAEQSDAVLQSLKLPDVELTSITRGNTSSQDPLGEVAYYDVEGTIGGTIKFELLLPDKWNKRFVMGGGGGFVGSIQNQMRDSVKDGYATVGTDTGHEGFDAKFGLDDALAQVNFGHVAVHRTVEVSKAIIRAHYGADPEFSYFVGCSRGGGQGMMASQRYPEDFDGIIAGAPAMSWTGMAATFLGVLHAFYPDPNTLDKTVVSKAEMDRLATEIMRLCDEKDGVRDGIISDPLNLQFDLDEIEWLSDAQRQAIQTIYDGARNQEGPVSPGFPVGGEADWFGWHVGPMEEWPIPTESPVPTAGYFFSENFFKYLVFNDPEWDYSTFDFSSFAKDTRLAASTFDAVDTDLSAFADRGGKIIIWHGLADAGLSPLLTIEYFDDLLQRDPNAGDYARLYLIPGCFHCFGGPGVSVVDWFDVIVRWVEDGEAPGAVIASKPATENEPSMTRPLSPYPTRTVYKGSGDPHSASSYESIAP